MPSGSPPYTDGGCQLSARADVCVPETDGGPLQPALHEVEGSFAKQMRTADYGVLQGEAAIIAKSGVL